MNKQKFYVIVVLMSLALLGIISMQAYWIKHDVNLKQKQFDQSVKQALIAIIDQVEQQESMRIMAGNFFSGQDTSWVEQFVVDTTLYNLIDDNIPLPPAPPSPPDEVLDLRKRIDESIVALDKRRERNVERTGRERLQIDSTINIKIEKDVSQKEIIAIQMNRSGYAWDSITDVTEKRVKSKLRKFNNLMQRFTFQLIDPDENPLKRVNVKELDSIIYSELAVRELPVDYNFGIKQSGCEGLVFSKQKETEKSLLKTNYKANLFPNDVFNRNDFLLLAINGKINFILMSSWPMLLSSLLFSLIVIIGFAYSVHVILKQKRLADIKSDFINNMTHEFKTPIATIAIANEAIKDQRINTNEEKLKYYTSVIHDENQRMLKQVENVLQIAQIDKGELTLRKENIDMYDVIQSAISKVQLIVEQRNGIIETDFKAIHHIVYGDGNHLLNSVINLLDNAVKYTPENPVIKVQVVNVGNELVISVNDNGIGMTKETQKKIFETFFRAQTGNIHDVKGFGLGLSYVKAIVESHDGIIDVQSEINKGSTFILRLPLTNLN